MEEKEVPINFFSEEIDFELENEEKTSNWLQKVANEEGYVVSAINYIFCDDEYLHKINMEYLNHNTYTDIITFDNSDENTEQEQVLEADIFISIERVKENSKELKTTFHQEIHRVMVHGLLHLTGNDDHSVEDKKVMREKEDKALGIVLK